MPDFTVKHIKGNFYAINNEEETLEYTLYKSNCGVTEEVKSGELPTGEKLNDCIPDYYVNLNLKEDGQYSITVTDGMEESTLEIDNYSDLKESIIEGVLESLCDCNCCENCGSDNLEDLLTLRTKIDVFKRLINPKAVSIYDTIYKEIECMVFKETYCGVNNEMIRGYSKFDEDLFKKMIALDYLSIYYYEKDFVEDTCGEGEYIDAQFKIKEIFCCISNLNININGIKEKINNMAEFNITVGAYVNQAPSQVGDYSTSTANRTNKTLTLNMFTTDTTPAYADPEGDSAQAVRIDSLPSIGQLQLNGTPVGIGQIISVTDISNNNLVYVAPNQDALANVSFNFSVSDVGSGQFTS